MKDIYGQDFWNDYADHFWCLNDKTKVKENSVYYDGLYNDLMPKNKKAKIVDIGCGGGHFLYYLARRGYKNISGVDLTPELVKFVRKEICPNVKESDAIEFLKKNKEKFDCIVANDILEHFPKESVMEFLSLAYKNLNKNGALIIKTINMCNMFASRNRYVDFTHEVGFTEFSLSQVCHAAGFKEINLYPDDLDEKRFGYKIQRYLYGLFGEQPPKILSTNIIAVSKK